MSWPNLTMVGAVFLCLLVSRTADAQVEITGSRAARNHEYLTGDGLPVDFTGIALNEEGRFRALSYSESQLGMLERQCQGWPAFYLVQGPFGLKIWSETDPIKGNVISYKARKLAGANLVIGGKIRRMGERVNVELDMIDPRKPQHLASAHIAYTSDQPGSIQKQMRASLVKLLQLKVTKNEMDDASGLPAANESYLEGTGYLHRFDISGNLDKAIGALNRAVERDPNLGSAYVGLSEAYGRRYRDTKDPQFLDRARESAAKAIELNGSSASAHWASGVVPFAGR